MLCVKVTTSVSMTTGLIHVIALSGGLDAVVQVVNLVRSVSENVYWRLLSKLLNNLVILLNNLGILCFQELKYTNIVDFIDY